MKISINAKTVDEILRKQEEALQKTGEYLAWKLKKNVRVDTGNQAASINVAKMWRYRVFVGTNVPQAWTEEYGRKPWRFPNLDQLTWWAGRKWFHKWRKTGWYDALKSADKWTVFVIARSIARKWIPARKTYTNTWKQEIENMKKKFYQFAKL